MSELTTRKRSIISRLKRRASRYFTKRTLLWLLIIFLCSFIISAVTIAMSPFIEKFYTIIETGHRPTDVDTTAKEPK
jgi:hypothetical protein